MATIMEIIIKAQNQASDVLDKVGGSTRQLGGELEEAGTKGGKLSDIMHGVGMGIGMDALNLATDALGKVTGAFGEASDALRYQGILLAQTEAGIKSTGGAAGVTAGHITGYADSIEKATGVEAEAIQSAQNMLLTFTGVRNEVGAGNDVFDQATQAITDMATKMAGGAAPAAQEMQTASIQLGKALNDPIAGITALSKVGVAFTDGQKKQIAEMVASGDVMGAQKVILKELETEFGGAAKAFGETDAGVIAKGNNSMGDSFERMAKPINAITTTVMPMLADALSNAVDVLDQVGVAIAPVIDAMGKALPGAIRIAQDFVGALTKMLDPLISALKDITSNSDTFKGAVIVLGGIVAAVVVPPFLAWAAATIVALLPIIAIAAAVAALIVVLDKTGILTWLGEHVMPVLGAAFNAITTTVLPALMGGFSWLADNILAPLALDLGVLASVVLPLLGTAFGTLKDVVSAAMAIVRTLIQPVIDTIGRLQSALDTLTGHKTNAVGTSAGQIFGGGGSTWTKPIQAYASGAWDVVDRMLAIIDPGEMVLPAAQASGLRSAAAVGGFSGGFSGSSGGGFSGPLVYINNYSGGEKEDERLGRILERRMPPGMGGR